MSDNKALVAFSRKTKALAIIIDWTGDEIDDEVSNGGVFVDDTVLCESEPYDKYGLWVWECDSFEITDDGEPKVLNPSWRRLTLAEVKRVREGERIFV